jgi:hypothetical protein
LELIPTNRDSNTKKYKEMNTSIYDGSTVPAAYVTVGRQRVKQYGNTVYLNNGNEFEVELFNPTTTKVLAKIELNGVSLGSGIVLRPGERVFLERYLNEAKRFLFETYEVDGNNPGVQKAIANNGQVSVKFYSEYINYGISYTGGSPWTTTWPPFGSQTFQYYGTNSHNMDNSKSVKGRSFGKSANTITRTLSANSVFTSSCSAQNFAGGADAGNDIMGFMDLGESISFAAPAAAAPIETGRIEKGSRSNQGFTYDSTTFNTWWSWSSEWKILPMSQKPMVREDLVIYCPSCQAKRRKESHKFCPICGTKY